MLSGLSLGVRCARLLRFQPKLEQLEGRDCPAAPTITTFSATQVAGGVLVQGTVSDETPGTVSIEFSGAGSGIVSVDSAGHFSETISLSAIDTVFAVATDEEFLQSDSAQSTPQNNAPVIVNFDAWREYGSPGNIWTFSGRVIDESPSGYVTLSGISSLAGVEVPVDENGYFCWTCGLAEQEEGVASANYTDIWGVAAETAYKIVRA